jgi:hypothetical protein
LLVAIDDKPPYRKGGSIVPALDRTELGAAVIAAGFLVLFGREAIGYDGLPDQKKSQHYLLHLECFHHFRHCHRPQYLRFRFQNLCRLH